MKLHKIAGCGLKNDLELHNSRNFLRGYLKRSKQPGKDISDHQSQQL